VRIKLPIITAGLISNLLGVFGLIALVVAVGGLAGWWWALVAGGVFAVALSYLIGLREEEVERAEEV